MSSRPGVKSIAENVKRICAANRPGKDKPGETEREKMFKTVLNAGERPFRGENIASKGLEAPLDSQFADPIPGSVSRR